jgi:hypothetical protein
MATTFTWSIDRISTFQEPQPNYVAEVCWTLMGVDDTTPVPADAIGIGENYVATVGDRTTLVATESTFIPYAELTEETLIGWLQNTLGVSGVNSAKAKVQAYIDRMINPSTGVPKDTPLPWVQG